MTLHRTHIKHSSRVRVGDTLDVVQIHGQGPEQLRLRRRIGSVKNRPEALASMERAKRWLERMEAEDAIKETT